ncbi:MAG: MauE/DoxX family redox-associated membrane protein [Sphingobacteriaceae bacterium]
MKLVLKIFLALFSAALGLVFIYSGYTKLDPVIETFEFTFVDIGIGNWYTAPVIARLLIGLEFMIGILLIINYNLKKFTLPLTIGLLGFFCIYLLLQIIFSGNSGNCGCFGEHLKMTPLQAIIKNVVMIVAALPIYFYWNGWSIRFNKLFISFFGLTAVMIPFIVNPVDYTYTSNNLDEEVNYPLELDLLFKPEDTSKVERPIKDIRKGKYVLAFLSLKCPHCRIAAKKFHLIHKNNPEIPLYFVLNGDKKDLKAFYDDTRTNDIPATFALGKSFVNLSGTNLPKIYYIDNSIVIKKVDYYELNQYQIEDWLKGK